MRKCILERAKYRIPQYVSSDPYDEEFAEAGVEDQFRRHATVAATKHGGIRMLPLGKVCKDFLLHRRKPRLTTDESVVAFLQSLERLFRRELRGSVVS